MHNPYIFPMFFLIFIFILNSPEVASGIAVKHLFLYWVFTMLWGHWEVLIFLRSGGKTSRDERVFIRRPSPPPPPPACLSVCVTLVCVPVAPEGERVHQCWIHGMHQSELVKIESALSVIPGLGLKSAAGGYKMFQWKPLFRFQVASIGQRVAVWTAQ